MLGFIRHVEFVEYSRLPDLLVHVLVGLNDALPELILLLLLDLRRIKVLLNRVLVGSLIIHRVLRIDLNLPIRLELVRVCALILAIDVAQQEHVVRTLAHELRVVVVQIRVREQFVPGQPLLRIVLQAAVEEIEALQRHLDTFREVVVALLEVVLQVILVAPCEWREAREHLEEDSAEGPDVDFVVVRLPRKDLRRHVDGSAAHCSGHVVFLLHLFREAQISDDNIDLTNKWRCLFELVPFLLVHDNFLVCVPEVNEDVG